MYSRVLLLAGLASLATATTAGATTFTNGGFESGLTGWTVSHSVGTAPVVIAYGQASSYPTGAFGQSVPAPAGSGGHGAYFSSDNGHDILSQSLALALGKYLFSFDIYAPANGRANPSDANFDVKVNGTTEVNGTAKTLGGGWHHYSFSYTVASVGNSVFAFDFFGLGHTGAVYAADVVVDNFNVAPLSLTAPVPEPSTWAMMMIGFAGLGYAAYRRKRVARAA